MSYSSPITSSSANISLQGVESESYTENKARICSLLFASIWAATAGATIAQALNPHVSWPIAITLPLPIFSLLIPDCCGNGGSLKERVSSCAKSIFTLRGAVLLTAFGLGVASSVLVMSYTFPVHSFSIGLAFISNSANSILLLTQLGLLGVHFLSAYAKSAYSKENAGEHESIDESSNEIEEVNPDIENVSEEHKKLMGQIANLKENNAKMEKAFKKLKIFIESDPELKQSFTSSYKATRNMLLPLYEMSWSPYVGDPLIEEWSKQAHLDLYYEALILRLERFLEVNPEFLALLQTKIDQKK
ncbi:MAG: hypothetical protein ACXU9U_01595 [Parachlamydiaceae bacterium]